MCGRRIHEIYIKCKVSSFNLEVIYVWGTVIVIVIVVGCRDKNKDRCFLMSSSPHCALASKFLRCSISVLAARSSLWRHIIHKQRSAISTNVSAQSCNLEKLIETIERESPSHRNRFESECELSALFRVTNSQTKYRRRKRCSVICFFHPRSCNRRRICNLQSVQEKKLTWNQERKKYTRKSMRDIWASFMVHG